MKRHIYLFITSVLMFGCGDDFLERKSLTQMAESNFWQTEPDAKLGINGIYEVLQDRVLYSGNLNGKVGIPGHDNLTDNSLNQWKWEGAGNFVQGKVDPSEDLFNLFWSSNYQGVVRSNQAIYQISKMTEAQIPAQNKASLLGQAHFLRALFYFNIAMYFENAPLITEPQTLATAYVTKSSYEDIISQVIGDLEFARDNISTPDEPFGYATKGAALGLLARVHLYEGQYDEVLKYTEQAMGLGYTLHPDYASLFSLDGEYSNEIVFSVRFLEGASHNNGELFSATYLGIPKVDIQPMPNMVNDYYCKDGLPIDQSDMYDPTDEQNNRDPRLNASVYFKGDVYILDPVKTFKGNTNTGYGLKKYIRNATSELGAGVGTPGSQDFYVIRYADILLMRAEALVESNQLTQEVYDLIDQVRGRVNMPQVETVEGTGLSQSALREIVRHERRVELAFEGLRFMDLKRWELMEEAYQRMVIDNIKGYNPVYQGEKSESFPIPLKELDANKKLEQNSPWN